ncbi:MAG: hypothetical protein IK043_01790 [Candidatus Methanomethylophilaceae archaeon]|nr:hypothetical protein [Candidatus Methanomethylophilaceae archaeon]
MAMPAVVKDMFSRPDTTKVLVTADANGQPHAIVCGSTFVIDDNTLAVGEVLMATTKANMRVNNKVALEAISGPSAYEVRGKVIGCQDRGPVLDKLNLELSKVNLKAKAVWMFSVEEVYDESAGPRAGQKIA